jgi:hypothetical protein
MIKKTLIGLGAIIAIILVVAAFQPDTYVIERTATISAAPEVVYNHITDQRDWQRSNPWVLEDPTSKAEFSGPAAGVGSSYSWSGDEVGKGSAKIVEARPFSYVKASLHFIEPFESMAVDEYLLEPAANGTKVTQRMSGENSYIGKLIGLFMSMDSMIGGMFEREFELMNKNLTTAGQ